MDELTIEDFQNDSTHLHCPSLPKMIVRQLCARQGTPRFVSDLVSLRSSIAGRRFLSERTSRISFRPLTTEVESARNPQSAEAASEQLASTSIPAVEPAPIQSVGVAESVENTFARIKDQRMLTALRSPATC